MLIIAALLAFNIRSTRGGNHRQFWHHRAYRACFRGCCCFWSRRLVDHFRADGHSESGAGDVLHAWRVCRLRFAAHRRRGRPDGGNSRPEPALPVAVIGAILVGAALGVVLERGLLRWLYSRPVFQLVLTFGVSLVLIEAIKAIWTTTPYSWTEVFGLRTQSFSVFGQGFSVYRLFIIGMGFLLIIGIALLLQRTRIGIIIRAGVEDSAMVEALGINVRAIFTLVFTLGCAVAALGGAVAAPFLGAAPSLGNDFLLQGIAVVVLGGDGQLRGRRSAACWWGWRLRWRRMQRLGRAFRCCRASRRCWC